MIVTIILFIGAMIVGGWIIISAIKQTHEEQGFSKYKKSKEYRIIK